MSQSEFPALYVIFEGIDGAGKSTRIKALTKKLEECETSYKCSFEPTNGKYGQQIRQRSKNGPPMTAQEELELFLLDRREHTDNLLATALKQYQCVIQDRSFISSAAYQCSRSDSNKTPQEILQLHDFVFQPDIVVYLDLPVTTALQRIGNRGESDAFEERQRLEAVRRNYEVIRQANWLWLDGEQDGPQLDRLIFDHVSRHLAKKSLSHRDKN